MIVECPSCGTKNRIPDDFHAARVYRCGSCKGTISTPSEKPEKQDFVWQSCQTEFSAGKTATGQERKQGKHHCFDLVSSFGPYMLNEPVASLEGLTELSALERMALSSNISNDKVFESPPVDYLGYQWQVLIGSVGGQVYKIAPSVSLDKSEIAERLFKSVFEECCQRLGIPSEQHGKQMIWNTNKGNVLLNHIFASGLNVIILMLTSSDAIKKGGAKLRPESK